MDKTFLILLSVIYQSTLFYRKKEYLWNNTHLITSKITLLLDLTHCSYFSTPFVKLLVSILLRTPSFHDLKPNLLGNTVFTVSAFDLQWVLVMIFSWTKSFDIFMISIIFPKQWDQMETFIASLIRLLRKWLQQSHLCPRDRSCRPSCARICHDTKDCIWSQLSQYKLKPFSFKS